MTKDQLLKMYAEWAEKHRLFSYPDELDYATALLSFDTGHTDTEYSGTQIFAVTKHKKGKIHMFVFALNTTWPDEDDFDDVTPIRESYRKVISF